MYTGTAHEECTALASQLKEQKKFVNCNSDAGDFSLKCLVCNAGLRGPTEAREHAKSTGHQNFGQM